MALTQQQIVKDWLERKGSITTLEASNLLFIMDLQSVIRCLKKKGMDINDKWRYKTNRYGRRIKFKKYFIRNENFFRRLADWWAE